MTSFSSIPNATPPESGAEYRAVSPWAVVSLLLGLLSVTAALDRLCIVIPLAGVLIGWRVLRQLRRCGEVQTGITLARIGIATSVFFAISGTIFLQVVMNDVPHGYTEIAFEDLQPDPGQTVSRYAVDLQPTMRDDRKVFIRGYIYPGRRTQQIKEFMLVPTLGHCAFCFSQLRPTDFVRVKLVSDYTVDYKSTEIGIGGRLRVNSLSGQTPYFLEADYVHQ